MAVLVCVAMSFVIDEPPTDNICRNFAQFCSKANNEWKIRKAYPCFRMGFFCDLNQPKNNYPKVGEGP